MRTLIVIISLLLLSSIGYSATYYIPTDYGTIQGAIDASDHGDTLIVEPGFYFENINFNGKAVTLKSEHGASVTCIDGFQAGSVITCENGEGAETVLEGFAIYNGSASVGGGMHNVSSSPTVTQCAFIGNTGYDYGGGMFNNYGSSPRVTQCTFYGNSTTSGGAISNSSSYPTVTNCILWGNSPDEISGDTTITITYSCIKGGYTGVGNIDSNPLFRDPANSNFRLSDDSPCIDAGDSYAPFLPDYDFEGDDRIIDGDGDGTAVVDMGIDEALKRPSTVWVDDDWSGSIYGDPVGGHMFGHDAFDTIQDGIDRVLTGGTVQVADGIYTGERNRRLNFNGRALTVKSENGPDTCILDGEQLATRGFFFYNGEGADSRVEGFTICNHSRGIDNHFSSPTVIQCIFQGNTGSGMFNEDSSSPTVIQCTFQGNSANYGGGMCNFDNCSPTVTQCTFQGNTAYEGGGIFNQKNSSPTVTNCIIWGNTPDGIFNYDTSAPIVTYSCIQGGYTGIGNIDIDPCFCDPANMDLHLSCISPCIDAGDNSVPDLPDFDLDGDARIIDGDGDGIAIVDMGIDESLLNPSELWIDDDWNGSSYGDPVGGGHIFGIDAFCRIQDGIDGIALNGTVHVADGTYTGAGNCNLDFNGKVLALISKNGPDACIIDCEHGSKTRGFHFHQGEGSDARVEGFTICNGTDVLYGGGMFIENNSSPKISQCTFLENSAGDGGAFYSGTGSSPTLTQCTFKENSCAGIGGGVCAKNSSLALTHCAFQNNSGGWGGGLCSFSTDSTPVTVEVTQCTFLGNSAEYQGGGIFNLTNTASMLTTMVTQCTFYTNTAATEGGGMCNNNTSPVVTNCILWGDSPDEIYNENDSDPDVSNSCVQGGYPGGGNIDLDPLMYDPANGDLHLTHGSPCRNAGDNSAPNLPATDIEGDPRIVDGTVDMGADEFHPHLYCTGDAVPGGTVAVKFIGDPGSVVRLWLGAGVLPTPASTKYGEWYLQFPLYLALVLGGLPAPNGVLEIPVPIPMDITVPTYAPLQAGVGLDLTNLYVLKIQ